MRAEGAALPMSTLQFLCYWATGEKLAGPAGMVWGNRENYLVN